jgi:hypothetical protein
VAGRESAAGPECLRVALRGDLTPAGLRIMHIAPGAFLALAYDGSAREVERAGRAQSEAHGQADEYASLALETARNDYLAGGTGRSASTSGPGSSGRARCLG